MSNVNENRIFWIDYLRVFSIIFVVVIHSLGGFSKASYGNTEWWINNIVDSFAHFSVPLFIMISGSLILGIKHEKKSSVIKRLIKIFKPFLFWSIVIFCGNIITNKQQSTTNYFYSFVLDFINNDITNIYWFVYLIMGLYLTVPFVKMWIKDDSPVLLEMFLIFWLLSTILKYPIFSTIKFDLTFFAGYIGYFILGFYLRHTERKFLQNSLFIYSLIIIGFFLTVLGNYYITTMKFESYLNFNIVLLSSGVFLFFRKKSNYLKFNSVINFISKYSFGIYLTHFVFISILSRVGVNCLTVSPFIGVFIVSGISIFSSIFVLYVLNKIPHLNKFIGIQ